MDSVSPISADRSRHRQSPSISVSRNTQEHKSSDVSPSRRTLLSSVEREREESTNQAQDDAVERLRLQMSFIKARFDRLNTYRSTAEFCDQRFLLRSLILSTFSCSNHHHNTTEQTILEQLCKDALAAKYFTPHRNCLHKVERVGEMQEFSKSANNKIQSTTDNDGEIDELLISDRASPEYFKFQTELSRAVENCEALKNLFILSFGVGATQKKQSSSNQLVSSATPTKSMMSQTNSSTTNLPSPVSTASPLSPPSSSTTPQRFFSGIDLLVSTQQLCFEWLKLLRDAAIFAQDICDFSKFNSRILEKKFMIVNPTNSKNQREKSSSRSKRNDRNSPSPASDENDHLMILVPRLVSPQQEQSLLACAQFFDERRAQIVAEANKRKSLFPKIPSEFCESFLRRLPRTSTTMVAITSTDNESFQQQQHQQQESQSVLDRRSSSVIKFSEIVNRNDDDCSQPEEEQTETHNVVVRSIMRGDGSSFVASEQRGKKRETTENTDGESSSVLTRELFPTSSDEKASAAIVVADAKNNGKNKNIGKSSSSKSSVNRGANDVDISGTDRSNVNEHLVPTHDCKKFNAKDRSPAKVLEQAMNSKAEYHILSNEAAADDEEKTNNAKDNKDHAQSSEETTTTSTPQRKKNDEQQHITNINEADFGVQSPDFTRTVRLTAEARRQLRILFDPALNNVMSPVTHKLHPRYYDVAEHGAILLVTPFFYFAAFFFFAMVILCRPADTGYDHQTSMVIAMVSATIIVFALLNPDGSLTVNARSIPRILEEQRKNNKGKVNTKLVEMQEAMRFAEYYANRAETKELERQIEETKMEIVGELVATEHARRKVILPKHCADTHLIELNERRYYNELYEFHNFHQQLQQQQNGDADNQQNNNSRGLNNNNNLNNASRNNTNNNNNTGGGGFRFSDNQPIGGGARTVTNGGTPRPGMSNNNNSSNNAVRTNNNNNNVSGRPPLANSRN